MNFQAIPIIRIFDEDKAKEFYLGFLGMRLDWEHRFEPDSPIYMQVSRDNLVFHLSEHSGDCTPGSKVFVNTDDLDALHKEITSRGYKYNRPEITTAAWGSRVFEVMPAALRLMAESRQRTSVAGDAVVGVMAAKLAAQCPLLLRHRLVAVAPAPVPDLPHSATEAGLGGLALYDLASLPGAPLVVREAEQVETTLALRAVFS